jgi:ParB/RepB/Spo0J family partition protein
MENKDLTLVVLAAGIGSRYGGLKQVDPIGPNGELIIDYSLYDARQAGFNHVVFVIRKDIEEIFKEKIGQQAEKNFKVSYVFQELNKGLPSWFSLPPERKKPWGTGHAVLLCKDVVNSNFAIINSDDFYGRDAFVKMADALKNLADENELYHYLMIGYQLKNTLSEHGAVSRGVCSLSPEGYLIDLKERTKIQKFEDGIKFEEFDTWLNLSGDEIVSMNFFGFTPSIFYELETRFYKFLMNLANPEKSEFYLSEIVGQLVRENRARVTVLPTNAKWFGVTYPEDRALVEAGIRNLIDSGEYPEKLWPDLIAKETINLEEKIYHSEEKQKSAADIQKNDLAFDENLGPIKEAVYLIEVEKIKPNPYQPRKHFDDESLKELAESIREYGILQPLIVSRVEKETDFGRSVEYQLIAGERRLRAAQLLGLERVPAIIRPSLEERQKLEAAIIENIQRSDLNPLETARGFAKLADEFGLPQREIAERIGKSRAYVANMLRLLELPSEAQRSLEEGKITESHARLLLSIQNPEKQRALLGEILSRKLTVRETEILTRRILEMPLGEFVQKHQDVSISDLGDALEKEIERKLEEIFGTKVEVKKRGNKGKITINFFSEEELNEILKKLVKE